MSAQVTKQDIDNASKVLRDQIALVEGDVWKAHDERESLDGNHGSTRRAVERFLRHDVAGYPLVIYGHGGVSRYFIEAGGVLVFSLGHNRDMADKARAYGFEVK